MFNRKILAALVLAGTTLASMASYAAPAATKAAPCILREHGITAVTPYRVEGHQGRVVVQELRGATVFVQAEPGLTAEWLQLTLGRHLAEMRAMGGMKECRSLQRKRFRRRESPEDSAAEPADDRAESELIRRDLTQAALTAMSELPEIDRETLLATFLDEATTVGGATLRKRRERALDRLRKSFRRLYGLD